MLILDPTVPLCTYCGDYATTYDHVPPRTVSPQSTYTVPACDMCNSRILHDVHILTVIERRLYVQHYLMTGHHSYCDDWRKRHMAGWERTLEEVEDIKRIVREREKMFRDSFSKGKRLGTKPRRLIAL